MNEAQQKLEEVAADQGSRPSQAQPREARKQSGWFMTGVKVTFATNAWRKQAAILKRRGSFPLLRQVLKNSATANKVLIPTDAIAYEYLIKSIVGHRLMMAAFATTFLYFLYLFIKGLAVAIKFGAPLNLWLIMSTPMLVYCALRFRLSWKVLTAFLEEKKKRGIALENKGASINVAP